MTTTDLENALLRALIAKLAGAGELRLNINSRPDGSSYLTATRQGGFWGITNCDIDRLATVIVDSIISKPLNEEDSVLFDSAWLQEEPIRASEAARLTGRSRQGIRDAIANGKLSYIEGTPGKFLRKADVLAWSRAATPGRPRRERSAA